MVQKAESGWWKKLLRGEGKAPHYVKVDWDKWVDEDEDNGMLCMSVKHVLTKFLKYKL